MMEDPQLDPMGALITEARADADLAMLVGTRVRGYEPAPKTPTSPADAQGPGAYQAFVVISALDVPPHPRIHITFADYFARCYGSTPQNAWAVWAAFAKAFHMAGPRSKTSGLLLYRTLITGGGQQETDPDTKQPLVSGTIRVIASTQAVA